MLVGEGAEELRAMADKLEREANNTRTPTWTLEGYVDGLRTAAGKLRRRAKRLDRALARANAKNID